MNKAKVTKEQVKEIAKLAMIKLSDEEIEKYQKQFSSILKYVEKLKEVDTQKIEYKSHTGLKNVLREDKSSDSLTQEEAIFNRKDDSKGGFFTIKSAKIDE